MVDDPFKFLVDGRRARNPRLRLPNGRRSQLKSLVRKAPEVMVKVSGGGATVKHVGDHMNYITRNGELTAITDHDDRVSGKDEVKELLDSWDMELQRGQGKLKQAFNIVLSMPAGTPPEKLLESAKAFAREEFYGQHHYMMVLHTPEIDPHKDAPPHPHVHLVVKAESHEGKRLYIRKATLEKWRFHFAEQLRERGIEANATPREVRGKTKKQKVPGVYFAEKRNQSRVTKSKVEEAAKEIRDNVKRNDPWDKAILAKRKVLVSSLIEAAKELDRNGDTELAREVIKFAKELPALETERHSVKKELAGQIEKTRVKDKERDDKER
ncbi:relaxase/mobilization nuclease domain-containing protein [Salmonella enterica]|uniref:relaxase/mobilization nuclease domain-containing protein n=1 Tax=Salmonella enterica TaxID=28901 RepID=UPI003BBF161A